MRKASGIFFLWILVLGLQSTPMLGQDKETIRERKIASRTVHEYFLDEGMDEPLVESIERYDEKGNLLEVKEFNSRGDVKLWEIYSYNEAGDVVETQIYNTRGKLESREVNIYSDGLRVKKEYYNNKNKLVKRKVYEYEFRD